MGEGIDDIGDIDGEVAVGIAGRSTRRTFPTDEEIGGEEEWIGDVVAAVAVAIGADELASADFHRTIAEQGQM